MDGEPSSQGVVSKAGQRGPGLDRRQRSSRSWAVAPWSWRAFLALCRQIWERTGSAIFPGPKACCWTSCWRVVARRMRSAAAWPARRASGRRSGRVRRSIRGASMR